MTGPQGDVGEIEALVTDRYLDALLGSRPEVGEVAGPEDADGVGAVVRAISQRLATDLPRFHPSFRFEERLALRLAELAASMRLPVAAGGEGQPIPLRRASPMLERRATDDDAPPDDRRPLLLGGAVAASAISLAGAWLAWRRRATQARAGGNGA
ncbi:MAG: hypothetical protein FIA92_08115 [Chloroflexi bacterium]|nr:hypothetical protein [Chloroflexota bacterium]